MTIDLDRLEEIIDACPIRKGWGTVRDMNGDLYLGNSKDYQVLGVAALADVPDGWREFIQHFDPELAEEMVARLRQLEAENKRLRSKTASDPTAQLVREAKSKELGHRQGAAAERARWRYVLNSAYSQVAKREDMGR